MSSPSAPRHARTGSTAETSRSTGWSSPTLRSAAGRSSQASATCRRWGYCRGGKLSAPLAPPSLLQDYDPGPGFGTALIETVLRPEPIEPHHTLDPCSIGADRVEDLPREHPARRIGNRAGRGRQFDAVFCHCAGNSVLAA